MSLVVQVAVVTALVSVAVVLWAGDRVLRHELGALRADMGDLRELGAAGAALRDAIDRAAVRLSVVPDPGDEGHDRAG